MSEAADMNRDAEEMRRYKEASQWLLKLNSDNASEAEVAEWLRWCEEHPLNLKAFEEMQTDWRDVVALRRDAAFSTLDTWDSRSIPAAAAVSERRWNRRLAAAAAFIAILAGVLWWNPLQQWQRSFNAQRIAAGTGNTTTSLPDGSLLVLRAQAEVKMNFAAAERRLELNKDSEAYFKVQRDPRRPFVVQAGELTIQAVGTAFDVRHDADRTRVVVEEGSVKVSADTREWMLQAGQQLEYMHRQGRAAVAAVNSSHALSWRNGEFAYERVALEDVIRDVNRYSTVQIAIPDAQVRAMPYTGTVFVRSIDDWLDALTLKYPVRRSTAAGGQIALELAEAPR